jgi:ABC-type sugar transport system permease subunit
MATVLQHPSQRKMKIGMPLTIPLAVAWHILLAIVLGVTAWNIFNMETLTILGRPADLGKPVQIFVGLLVLLPAVIGLYGSVLMLQHKNQGRYLSLIVNFGGFALSLFVLAGVWGFYDSFERITDMVLANGFITLGFPLAYLVYWLSSRMKENFPLKHPIEMGAIGLAMLTLIIVLFRGTIGNPNFAEFNIVSGLFYIVRQYATLNAWIVTIATLIFGALAWYVLHLGEYFSETPDERTAWQGWLMLMPNIVGFLLFFAGPLLLSFYLSFTNSALGQVPEVIWFENYAEILALEVKPMAEGQLAQHALSFGYTVLGELQLGASRYAIGAKDVQFWISLRNTLLFSILLLPLAIVPALGMSLILNSALPGVKFFRALYFLPSIAAVVGTSLIWRWLYSPRIGFINYAITTVAGWFGQPDPEIGWLTDPNVVLISIVLLSAWQVVGYNTVLFLAGLQGVPDVLYEAAQIDGANRWQQFWNVTLPMLAPTTFFVLITTMVTGLQVFNEPFALFPARPIPIQATTSVYYMYTTGFQEGAFGYSSAIAWVIFVIIFGLTLIQFRFNRGEAYD